MFRPALDFPHIYQQFNASITLEDCGEKCASFNPNGKPVCCDICEAVPCVSDQEWQYLRNSTDLWHHLQPGECGVKDFDLKVLHQELSPYQLLLACKGPQFCQREYRAISCRQFPFFPYITADFRFIGLAYYWQFESACWVLSNLDKVRQQFVQESIHFFDELFNFWSEEMQSYANLSEQMRAHFLLKRRRIPILHRNGSTVLLSPGKEWTKKINPSQLRTFSPFNP